MTEEIYSIGRAPDNKIRIDAKEVGKYHAYISVNENGVFIEDLDSLNGVYVNGFRIKEAMLNHRDKVTIAKKYDLDLSKLFKKINPELNPNDYTKEFLELKQVYDEFLQNKKKAIRLHQNKTDLQRFFIVTIPTVIFIVLAHSDWLKSVFEKSYFPIYIALTAALSCLLPFVHSENLRLIKLEREYKKKYKCPKCKMMLSHDWEIHREEKECPRCKAMWSD